VQISYSLKNILARIDRGEGLIGELTTAPETKQRLTDTVLTTMNKTNAALAHMESGKGVLGKLIYDDAYAEQLTASLGTAAKSLETITGTVQKSFETGEGAVPALLNDIETKKKIVELVDNLRTTSNNLATFSASMQTGQGIIPRLVNDKEYGDQALNEFTLLIRQLNEVVAKVNTGQGTAGKLISDPALFESVNDILIGINESKLLRWLIRSRQQAGIEKRVEELQKVPGTPPAPGPTPPPVDAAPVPPEDPDGVRVRSCGLRICPPSELCAAPDANSDRFALAMMIAPAARNCFTTNASSGGIEPSSSTEPPVVGMSAVSILSLMITGMPCNGERGPLAWRSASIARASSRAFGLTAITACSDGPLRS